MYLLLAGSLYSSFNSWRHNPSRFLYGLLSSPGAVESLRSISISYTTYNKTRDLFNLSTPVHSLTNAEKGVIKESLRYRNTHQWKQLASMCMNESGHPESLFATILMFAPNVQSLIVKDEESPSHTRQWLRVLAQATKVPEPPKTYPYQNLERVDVSSHSLGLRKLVPLFLLPSIAHLRLKGMVETDGFRWPVRPASSSVQTLYLANSFINSSLVVAIINSIRRLHHFTYEHFHGAWVDQQHWLCLAFRVDMMASLPPLHLDYPAIMKALQGHAQSMITLRIDEENETHHIAPNDNRGSLGSFSSLERLSLPFGAFTQRFREGHPDWLEDLPCCLQDISILVQNHAEHLAVYHSVCRVAQLFLIALPEFEMLTIRSTITTSDPEMTFFEEYLSDQVIFICTEDPDCRRECEQPITDHLDINTRQDVSLKSVRKNLKALHEAQKRLRKVKGYVSMPPSPRLDFKLRAINNQMNARDRISQKKRETLRRLMSHIYYWGMDSWGMDYRGMDVRALHPHEDEEDACSEAEVSEHTET